jgi:hypothetical protein
MARTRSLPSLDPTTGKPLPSGVVYRGPEQYRARKLVDGQRIPKTFTTARLAARWLAEVQVDRDRGLFVDRSEAERQTLGDIIERCKNNVLGDDSEKRGAEKERGHLKIVLEDPVCRIRLATLTSADLAKFRDRMKALEYAPATIVRRLNLIQTSGDRLDPAGSDVGPEKLWAGEVDARQGDAQQRLTASSDLAIRQAKEVPWHPISSGASSWQSSMSRLLPTAIASAS